MTATTSRSGEESVGDAENRLMRAVIGAANPLVKMVLGGPLHRPLSRVLLLLRIRGRKTGRLISTPVGYTRDGDRLIVVTSASYRWWRNVHPDGTDVEVRVAGQWWAGRARMLNPSDDDYDSTVRRFIELRGEKAAMQFGLVPARGGERVMIPNPRVIVIHLSERRQRPAA